MDTDKKSNKDYGLFVFLAKNEDNFDVIALDSSGKQTEYLIMGISEKQPGTYLTACGKGYGNCNEDDPETLKLIFPGIGYFAFENSGSVFFWDPDTKSFKRIWISD